MTRWIALTTLAVCVAAATTRAHDFKITEVDVSLSAADATIEVKLRVDVDALALGVSPEIPSEELAAELTALRPVDFEEAVDHARGTLHRRVRIWFDGVRWVPSIDFPEHGQQLDADAEPTVLGTVARLHGLIPAGATRFRFGTSRAFKVVHLTIRHGDGQIMHILEPGENAPTFRLDVAPPQPDNPVWPYTKLGFEHILPKGLDHILFVVGLFLLSARFKPLLWQITAFTVAHSITLAMSITGLVELPARTVEPLIALSIVYVAIENLCVDELKPWRPVIVFLFGLLHGLGFAGVLRELGLPPGQHISALIGFNVGVELGQITVVLLALLAVGWFRERPWYRRRVVYPASLAIAGIALYWTVERVVGS